MAWVKLDDGCADHPKLLAAGAAACWLWTCGLAYCNRQKKRDGIIPAEKVKVLYPVPNPLKLAAKLVEVGLWERVEGGYLVHDYHDFQPAAEQAVETAEARAAAGRRGGFLSGRMRRSKIEAICFEGESNSEATCFGSDEANTNPDPDPDPDPENRSSFDFEALYALYPRKEGKTKGLKACRTRIKTKEDYDRVEAAIRRYAATVAGKSREYVKHFSTFMNCWMDYAHSSATGTAAQEPNVLHLPEIHDTSWLAPGSVERFKKLG